jgi:hypothetical protein
MVNENAMIMANEMTALIEKLGILGAEKFVFNLTKSEPFDYTEWRRENLYEDISLEELAHKAAEFSREHPVKFRG